MTRHPSRSFDLSGVPDPRRRELLQLIAASMALAGGCAREPPEKIVPYAEMPEQLAAGKPLYFATALTRDGYGTGVLVESESGRPIKVEGNPNHPASFGATDIFAQAAVLGLWDPERSRTPLHRGAIGSWDELLGAFSERRSAFARRQGAGLRVLTGSVGSPTLAAQMQSLLERYPKARWHQYQPVNRDNIYSGARLAFGEPLEPRYHFGAARVVLSLDADFLASMPGHVRYARDFNGAIRPGATPSARNRLYVIESTPTLTGAKADHRVALRAAQIELPARALAREIGIDVAVPPVPHGLTPRWLTALTFDLLKNRGRSIIVPGERQPPEVHALASLLNERLGNVGRTVDYIRPVLAQPIDQMRSLRDLVADMAAGEVEDLIMLGVNPVYATPRDLEFGRHLSRVPFSVHLGLYRDETAARSLWHVPAAHELEAWSDARAFDGTVTIQQPLIAPLYGGRSAHEVIAALGGDEVQDGYSIVREHWRGQVHGADFETIWRAALHEGMLIGSAVTGRPTTVRALTLPTLPAALSRPELVSAERHRIPVDSFELILCPDPCVHDGSLANNAWLQELPKPLTQLTWDNAVLVSPTTARRRDLKDEDEVELRYRGLSVRAPVWILPGHPDDSVTVFLGYGRTAGGQVASNRGFDAYALQTSGAPAFGAGLTLHPTGARHELASTQLHNRMEGRDLARSMPASRLRQGPAKPSRSRPPALLYPPFDSPHYAWGMSINLDACIGCKACTIACQAENSIPVVGKSEVRRGREMHWIRVDRYFEGSEQRPKVLFQPVPCMHCERAPCEVVCPVEASIHDSDGLNVQVYNRCVGTRFCSNNCPYKVRRFNFLQYSQDEPSLNAQRNPEVTVRMRGVMEKCTYCIQRIAAAKIEAEKESRRVRDGEVVTACQAACPTQAIVFGDLADPESRVRQAKASPYDYVLLEELNTLPRTSYLPAVENPNPETEDA